MDDLKRLTDLLAIHRGRQCLLFLGAGFSIGAKRVDSDGELADLPPGRELVAIMANDLSDNSSDLSDLAGAYTEKHGEHGLYELLNSLYVAAEVSSTQETISSFSWKEVYTTNYDNVMEICLTKNGQRYSTYSPKMRPSDVDYRTMPIVHINGSVAGSNFRDFLEEVKLTDVQYVSDDFSRSAWGERFRSDILT